jgi:hypothetical protein
MDMTVVAPMTERLTTAASYRLAMAGGTFVRRLKAQRSQEGLAVSAQVWALTRTRGLRVLATYGKVLEDNVYLSGIRSGPQRTR